MSFNTSISGLDAAQADLGTRSNNIANVNTTGYKYSRTSFGDVYANSSLGGTAKSSIGAGVTLQSVAQQFTQGDITKTDNSLDLAINGDGFFTMSKSPDSNELVYSRAGDFGVDKNGYLKNGAGLYLRGFPVDKDGNPTSTSSTNTQLIKVEAGVGAPKASSKLSLAANLPSQADSIANGTAIDPSNTDTYTKSTSASIYDSLGNPHSLTYYYQKTATDNQWKVDVYMDGQKGNPSTKVGSSQLTFDPNGGKLLSPTNPTTYNLSAAELGTGAAAQSIAMGFGDTTQNSGSFAVSSVTQDGFTTGKLSGVHISEDGIVAATYTNGESTPLGKIAVANFTNSQGLQKIGSTAWKVSPDSGPSILGEAGTGTFGSINAGALESSNVDTTEQLVGLITAQRNFQANSKAIQANNTISQTLINL